MNGIPVLTLILALFVAVPYAIQELDRSRLAPEQRARLWQGWAWANYLYWFGPLTLVAHFWITRRSVGALLVGLVLAALLYQIIPLACVSLVRSLGLSSAR